MKWTGFLKDYPDEESCKATWKQYRGRSVHLPALCGCKEHYWKADKERHECKKCGYGRGLKSNAAMQGSRSPFRYRFMAIQMPTSAKKGIPAKELRRQLGRKDCNPAWAAS